VLHLSQTTGVNAALSGLFSTPLPQMGQDRLRRFASTMSSFVI
jgi:hypothetical protein